MVSQLEQFRVGQMITAYVKGYHRVVKIQPRWAKKDGVDIEGNIIYDNYDPNTCGEQLNPNIYYTTVFTKDGKPVKSNSVRRCDSAFCKDAKKQIDVDIRMQKLILFQLEQVKVELNK